MTKYHITKNGDLAICRARIRACRLGDKHFENAQEAEEFIRDGVFGKNNEYPNLKTISYNDYNDLRKWIKQSNIDESHYQDNKRILQKAFAPVAITLVGVGVMGGSYSAYTHHNMENAKSSYSQTVGAVKAYDSITSGDHQKSFHGSVMGENLHESSFNKCVKDGAPNGYVVCKTTDGRYTITAKPDVHKRS